jgi:hypothetical protein
MGLVTEFGHRVEHSGPRGGTDPPAAVQHVGNSLPAYAGGAGYILDGDVPLGLA